MGESFAGPAYVPRSEDIELRSARLLRQRRRTHACRISEHRHRHVDPWSRVLRHVDPSGGQSDTVTELSGGVLRLLARFALCCAVSTGSMAQDGYVGEARCVACHALEQEHWAHTVHAKIFRSNPKNALAEKGCEACHGPGARHLEDATDKTAIIAFTRRRDVPVEAQNAQCLQCHQGGERIFWHGSMHDRSRLSCSDCHNPHGSAARPLLKADSVNQLCYTCHSEKRGPFIWEHAPVRKNCLECHLPHGSSQESLLVVARPFLCQQCHANVSHPATLITRSNLPRGAVPDERAFNRSCSNCHAQIHGSNHPSGARFHR